MTSLRKKKVFRVRECVLFQKWSLELELASLRKKRVFRVRFGVVTSQTEFRVSVLPNPNPKQ